ncbi:MAG: cobyric acid synthase, partial [Firmicutes bacterium]|nr:cobyric acid synthase [Bacillota bacterium]
DVMKAYESLASEYDVIVVEGAGSPAEINLKSDDIVNMGLAKMVDAPVLLVGDIDRGGVFAQLYGTIALLEEDERRRVKGTVINKFRGDVSILKPGLVMLEDLCKVPVAGVIPYTRVDIDDEDSLSERFERKGGAGLIDIAAIRLPRISNFTDLSPFERYKDVSLRYVSSLKDLGEPDMIIIPGTKSTIEDLKWLRQSGLEAAVMKAAARKTPVFGICGGFQMLGKSIKDPEHLEASEVSEIAGMGILDTETCFCEEKTQTRTSGRFGSVEGIFRGLSGMYYEGYEIHMGRSGEADVLTRKGSVYGSYIHGIFDAPGISDVIVRALCERKCIAFESLGSFDLKAYKDSQYDILAGAVRKGLDMDLVYRIINREV